MAYLGHQIRKSNEDYNNDDYIKPTKDENAAEVLQDSDLCPPDILNTENRIALHKNLEVPPNEARHSYRRTLSGGLQSPKAEVAKTAILQRINSKKAAKSYQLGHQLTLKWSTGVGPRIGCIADYPAELRAQALEFTSLSPRTPPTPTSYRKLGGLVSPKTSPRASVVAMPASDI